MKGVIRWQGETKRYFVDGKEVTEEQFRELFPPPKSAPGPCSLVSFKPLASDALAVHPEQVQEATDDAKAKGVPTEFLPDGRPVFTSSRHFREYAKKYGFRHRGY